MAKDTLEDLVSRARRQRLAFLEDERDSGRQGPKATRWASNLREPDLTSSSYLHIARQLIAERPRTSLAVSALIGGLLASRAGKSNSTLLSKAPVDRPKSSNTTDTVAKGVVGLALTPMVLQILKQRLLPLGIQWAVNQAVGRSEKLDRSTTRSSPRTTTQQRSPK